MSHPCHCRAKSIMPYILGASRVFRHAKIQFLRQNGPDISSFLLRREGKGREGKGREGKGREADSARRPFIFWKMINWQILPANVHNANNVRNHRTTASLSLPRLESVDSSMEIRAHVDLSHLHTHPQISRVAAHKAHPPSNKCPDGMPRMSNRKGGFESSHINVDLRIKYQVAELKKTYE